MRTIPQYQRYIAQQLGLVTLIVALSLTSIVWLLQALRFVDYIVNRGVSVWTFLHLTALLLPQLLVMIVPVAVMVATLFVYSRLIQDSEMVVMFSAGLGPKQLARPLFVVGGGLVLLAYFFSLVLLPNSYAQFKDLQGFLRNNFTALLLQEEVFNSPMDGLTVYVHERNERGELKGILVHDSRQKGEAVTMMARQAILTQTPTGPRFILEDGNRQELRNGRLSLLHFERYPLDIAFYTEKAGERPRKADEMGMAELLSQHGVSQEDHTRRLAEFNNRLSWPFLSLALGVLSLGLLLRGEFNRRGQARRIALAAGLGVLPLILGIFFDNISATHAALIPIMHLNVFGALAIGVLALSDWKMPRFRQPHFWRQR